MVKRTDVLLLALADSKDHSLSPVQVQKAMFLLQQEAASYLPADFYKFAKYNYGPFSRTVYDDLTAMAAVGLVVEDASPTRSVRVYRLTAAGLSAALEIAGKVNPALQTYLGSVVEWVKALSFTQLVRAIYAKYPEYRENSVFAD